jgi:hypothetical protein
MKTFLLFALLLGLAFAATEPAVLDLTVHNRERSIPPDRPEGLRLDARAGDGVAWLVGSDFTEGTIEVDLRGANKPGQSFVGIAFRGVDDTTFDAVYFRPFNFKNPEVPRRSRAVQYVSMPAYPWERLRQENPGEYEATVNPVPDPDDWFHVRIVVQGRKVAVFVNDAPAPCLAVTELTSRLGGKIGFWVGNNSAGDFANLKITPRQK